MNRIRIKILLLVVLALSTFGLTRATAEQACGPEECVRVVEGSQSVGYGCVIGGTVNRKCTATLSGCVFDYCAILN